MDAREKKLVRIFETRVLKVTWNAYVLYEYEYNTSTFAAFCLCVQLQTMTDVDLVPYSSWDYNSEARLKALADVFSRWFSVCFMSH